MFALMLGSSLLIAGWGYGAGRSSAELWAGSLGLGFGLNSYVVAITLPSEARVELTPLRLLVLNLGGTAGEMIVPFLLGHAFESHRYGALGASLVALTAGITNSSRQERSRAGRALEALDRPLQELMVALECSRQRREKRKHH